MYQPESSDRPLVIVGAGENADIARAYFSHPEAGASGREVVAHAVEGSWLDGRDEHAGLPLVALEELAERFPPGECDAHVAISSQQLNRVRRRLFEQVKGLGYACASYVSPHAFVWDDVTIGENCFVFEHNVLQYRVSIGDDVVLWSGNHVGHRTEIADHCFISSHVVLSGFCRVGEHSFLGVNSCVGDEVAIAEDCVVGAGAVVVRDLPARGVYVGNPAKATGRDSFDAFGVAEQGGGER